MNAILLQILFALGSGALIAGLAVGIVLTYRGSGVINLAIGGYAMLAGYAFWAFNTNQFGFTVSKGPALALALVFVMAVAALAEIIIFQPLRNSPPLAKLVASLGLLLTMQASMLLAFGTLPQAEPQVLTQKTVAMLGAVVPTNRFIIAGIVIVATAVLAAAYRWTSFGLATRAASENEVSGMLRGLSPRRLAIANAVIAALLAGIVGILAAAITELDSSTLPLQVIPALAAAMLAGLSSLGLACLSGFGIGVLYGLVTWASGQSWFPQSGGVAIPGVTDVIVFLLVVLAMFARGANLPGRGQLIERGLPEVPKPKYLVEIAAPLAVVAAIALVVLPYDFRQAEVNSIIGIVMALSLVVITGFVGQISVVQLSLAGVAGFVISRLAHDLGVPFPVAPLAGVVGAVLLGLITAASALRVRGVSLVIVTLAAAQAISNFYFANPSFGAGVSGSPVPEPHIFGLDVGTQSAFRGLDGNIPSPVFGWFALATAFVLCVMVGYMRRGGFGRRMLAVRSNESASAAAAINPRNVKLIAFGVSALIAGTAGSLYAYNFGSLSPDQFDVFTALSLIAFAYAGGITLISGAVFAGLISTQALFPYALDKWFGLSGNWFLLFGGVILIVTLLQNPEGVMGTLYKKRHRVQPVVPPKQRVAVAREAPGTVAGEAAGADTSDDRGMAAAAAPQDHGATVPAPAPRATRPGGPPVLATEGLSVNFAGVHALLDVGLEIGEGELVGLIGPNGAGKTTFVDAVTGFVGSSGQVTLDGRDLRGMPPHERASLGLARTWQGGELFDDLLVEENLAVAQDRSPAWRIAFRDRADQQAIDDALALFGLGWAAKARPADLSQGHRKLVGVARALAAKPRLLLLDEPAAGLDTTESQALGAHLRSVADRGQSTLLIDHDMGLVLSICHRVIVLEFGKLIADGVPEVVSRDPRVVAAYLGGAEVELAATTPKLEGLRPEGAIG